jgi:hypothetical protein
MSSTESTESLEATDPTGITEPESNAESEKDADARPEANDRPGRPDRRGLVIAAVALLACGGLIGYGFLKTPEKPKARAVPTAEVTYEVTGSGTAELSYLARSESGEATVEKGVTLPWKKTVQVPLGKAPTVALVLDGKGGQASCTLAIRGKHVQRAIASGNFGRATCTGELPADEGEN